MKTLNVRVSAVGGGVAGEVSPISIAPSVSRVVIFVHGYNTTKQAAIDSYEAFLNLFVKHGMRTLQSYGQVWGFLWPGDSNLGIFSALSYPSEFGNLRKSAQLLANFLTQTRAPGGGPISLFLVCHSLGSRLALEMIRDLSKLATPLAPRLAGMCLMAAAVPVAMVEASNELNLAARAAPSRVLYSKDDQVLNFAFPPGETAAFEGFFPQAVGRFGNPGNVWTIGGDLAPYDHNDYFIGGRNGDRRSATHVAQMVGAGVQTPPLETQPSTFHLPPPRSLSPARATATRLLGRNGLMTHRELRFAD